MVSGMPSKTDECSAPVTADAIMSADELLALGKRHMLLDEYSVAVEFLANACQQLSNKYGDMGKECAPAYLMYGRCLLELARQNMGIVEPESAKAKGDSEEKKDEAGPSSEKMEEITEEEEEGDDEGEEEEDDEKNEKEDESQEKNGDEATKEEESEKKDENSPEGEADEEEEEDEDEADSYLKHAWTFLDLAKVIFLREKTVEGDFAAADCLMALGEVSMEGGNCEAGVSDMKEAIHLRRLHSGRIDRIVASSQYELGAALHQFQRYDEAVESLKECLAILTELSEKVIEKLKTVTDKEEEDNLQSSQKEFAELINEVKDKITEVEEDRSMQDLVKGELGEKVMEVLTNATESGSSANGAVGEVKTLTARRKPTADGAAPSPARMASALVSSLASAAENIDSPLAKSRVAALISQQLKRHRLDSPGAGNGDSVAVKRPASSNSTENDVAGVEPEDDGVSSKRIRANETDTATN